MNILAIESSCDETAAAVIAEKDGRPVILSNIVSTQIDIHKIYGGVVPEVAARAHIENILPVIDEALSAAKIKIGDIDYLAVTNGPGLIGSLVVGVETAKALSVATGIPLIPINHLEGHVYATFGSEIEISNSKIKKLNSNYKLQISNSKTEFPILTLMVSGGNTLLILMKDHLKYEVVGQTIDDAAGEAFDKGARLLGLGYPGGPIISKRASIGDASKYKLPTIDLTPKPIRNKAGFMEKSEVSLDFSFSGLKTALLNTTKTQGPFNKKDIDNLCASYQKAIVDTLIQNSVRAVKIYSPKTFILAGGVAANPLLREGLGKAIKESYPLTNYLIPPTSLCGDNAAMIGIAAYYRMQNTKLKTQKTKIIAQPNLKIV
jgi:N6-L-threonylcarbamoyladenine synthase